MSATPESSADPMLEALLSEAGWVLGLAKRLARDQAAAEDLAQSAMALAIERRPGLGEGLRPWLAVVLGRLARTSVRGEVRRREREALVAEQRGGASASGGGEEALERFELQQELARRVAQLPEPYRGVLLRRYYEGLSVGEIGRVTGRSPGTVRSQLARGLERLRLQYGNDSEGRDALGVFLLAAGRKTGFVSRRIAEIVGMKSSTKLVGGVAAAIAVAVGLKMSGLAGAAEAGPLDREAAVAELELDGNGERLESVASVAGEELERREVQQTEVALAGENAAPAVLGASAAEVSTVRARILRADSAPLAGATLSSVQLDGRANGEENVAWSGTDGRVALELADDAMRMWRGRGLEMVFAAGADGHATRFVVNETVVHGEVDLGELRLDPGGVLVGSVVDVAGLGLGGVRVLADSGVLNKDPEEARYRGPNSNVSRVLGISEDDGSFELTGVEVAESVRVWARTRAGLWATTESVGLAAGGVADVGQLVLVEVPAERRVDGVVLAPDGAPFAGARVSYFTPGGAWEGEVEADERGGFTVLARDDSAMQLVARDEGGEFGRSALVVARQGESATLRLQVRRSIAATVADQTGEPVFDAHLLVVVDDGSGLEGGGWRPPHGVRWVSTDAAGRAELEVPGRAFAISVKKAGHGEIRVGPFEADAAPRALGIELPKGPELRGRVLAYGRPVQGAEVAVAKWREVLSMTDGFPNRFWVGNRPRVITDAEGRFSLAVEQDWLMLPVVAQAEGLAAGEVILPMPKSGDVNGLEIHMTEGGAIEGAVVAPEGIGFADLYVAASRGDGRPISTKVDASGRYRFEGLTPGDWRVEGRLEEIWVEMLFRTEHPEDREFGWNAVVVDGRTTELEVDMTGLGDVQVRGQLKIDGVAPLAGWTVQAVPPPHRRWRGDAPGADLDAEGRFALMAEPGRAELRFVGALPGGATAEVWRDVRVAGPVLEWSEALTTASVEEWVESPATQVRFVRGWGESGDRVWTTVQVGDDGVVRGRVPVGESALEVERDGEWEVLRSVVVR